jgi:hypothetical protein
MTAPPMHRFEEGVVLGAARARTGLAEFGDPAFREPLRRLLDSLERESNLHAIGRATWWERIVGILVNRLRSEDWIARHPEILSTPVARPLVIVGLPRTGTTMLHRTIAADPRMFALRWYESRNPAPFPQSEGAPRDPRIDDAEREVAAMLEAVPDLLAAHPMDPFAPDEEIMLVEHAFTSWNPEAFCHVPSYAAWLEAEDATPGYRHLDRMLRFLQWQKARRGEAGRRWVLKAPYHLAFLDSLFAVFPDARVVLTHRDPVETVPSLASFVHTLHRLNSDAVDPLAIGAHWQRKLARATRRALATRAGRDERFLDLDYQELVAEPLACVQRIYDFAGMELTADALAAMKEWAVENARDRRPVHRYTLAEFGMTEEALARDFAEYRAKHLAG